EVRHVDPLGLIQQVEGTLGITPCLSKQGQRYPPAVRELGEAGGLAELLASCQVLAGQVQISTEPVDLAETDMGVGGTPHRPAGTAGAELQRVLVDARSGAQTAESQVDV